jgi:hypothetical protein
MDRDEIITTLARVETKVDTLIARELHHDKRLSAVEKKVWYASGVSAALVFIAGKLGLGT